MRTQEDVQGPFRKPVEARREPGCRPRRYGAKSLGRYRVSSIAPSLLKRGASFGSARASSIVVAKPFTTIRRLTSQPDAVAVVYDAARQSAPCTAAGSACRRACASRRSSQPRFPGVLKTLLHITTSFLWPATSRTRGLFPRDGHVPSRCDEGTRPPMSSCRRWGNRKLGL